MKFFIPANEDLAKIAPSQAESGVMVFRPRPENAPLPIRAPAASAPPALPPLAIRPAEPRVLVVGPGVIVEGTVANVDRLVVEGSVEARRLEVAELVIGPDAEMRGRVKARRVDIAGSFDGVIICQGSLTLRSTGLVAGQARCRRLAVEEGGQVWGYVDMLRQPDSPVTAPPPPVPPPVLTRR
jgi:cytoskeletal protein CcmA (bactofilin family)